MHVLDYSVQNERPGTVTVAKNGQTVCSWWITTDGFPLAYEVMNGNSSDRTTLRGNAELTWLEQRADRAALRVQSTIPL
jgi:hypothetical protein